MGYLTDLTDEQWAWIEPIFPPQEGRGRRRTVSLRRVIDALMYQDRSGCQWRLIPLDGSGSASNGRLIIQGSVASNALQIDSLQVLCIDIHIIAPDK